MKKRVLALLMAMSLAAGPAVYAAEDKTEQETAAETEAAEEAASEQEPGTEASEEGASKQKSGAEAASDAASKKMQDLGKALSEFTEEDLDEYVNMLEGMDKREALENVLNLSQTVQSEEFAHLMEYPEMQALIEEILKKAEKFIMEEPELMGKILVTMGLDEKIVNVLVALIRK